MNQSCQSEESCTNQVCFRMTRETLVGASLTFGVLYLASYRRGADKALRRALRSGGHVAVLRHAIAPGIADPSEFRLGDCSTQRNLSGAGRAQAKHIVQRFYANGIEKGRVYSSRWRRILEPPNCSSSESWINSHAVDNPDKPLPMTAMLNRLRLCMRTRRRLPSWANECRAMAVRPRPSASPERRTKAFGSPGSDPTGAQPRLYWHAAGCASQSRRGANSVGGQRRATCHARRKTACCRHVR